MQEAVREADIVICATTSLHPVLHGVDIKPGAHVNSVGPKTQAGHELGIDIAAMAGIIATDSREQCQNYAAPFFLHGSGHEQRMVELADIIVGRLPGRGTSNTTSLFCSVGLAGTDVAVASALLDQVWLSNNSRTSLEHSLLLGKNHRMIG